MKKAIKRLMFMAVFLLTFGLMGCGSTLKTDLSISDNFAGTRTMEVSIDKETFDEYAEEYVSKDGFLTLAKETTEKVPECMKFSYEETKNKYIFCFVMSFTSLEEYKQQVADVLGKKIEVSFVYSKSPFTREITVNENFSSEELLSWFRNLLVEKEYLEKEDVPYVFTTIENDIYVNGKKYECDENRINITQKIFVPIEEINVFSDIDVENEKIARKIELVFSNYNLTGNKETIEEYLTSVTPTGSTGEWQTIEDGEKFVLLIPYSSEEELSLAMQTFCASSDNTVELVLAGDEEKEDTTSNSKKWDEAVVGTQKKVDSQQYVQPFGFETGLSEKLDLSVFVCNGRGEIASSYYISAKNGKPSSKLYYPNEQEVYGWDYIDNEYPEYYYVETSWIPKYQVESNVNKYYVPESIKLNTTVKAGDKVTREFVFVFDQEIEKNTLNRIEQKLEGLFEDSKDLIKVSVKKRNKKTNIVWKISGDIKEVDEFCQNIFGSGYSLIYYYCQDRFVLNRQYDYQEIIDFRPIFDWEYKGNVDYSLKMTGKVNKDNSIVMGIADSTEKVSGKKLSCLSDQTGYLNIQAVGTTVNKPLAYGICILVVTILQASFAVTVYVGSKRANKNKKKNA